MEKNKNQSQNILDFLLFIYDETVVKNNKVQSSATKLMTDCKISNPSTVIKIMYASGLIKNVSTNKKFTDLKYASEIHPNIHMANKVAEKVSAEQKNYRTKDKRRAINIPLEAKPVFISTTNQAAKPDDFINQLYKQRELAIIEFNTAKEKLEKINQLIKLY